MAYEAEGTKLEQHQGPQPELQPEAHVYRAGRWTIRDGTGFGKPPYVLNLATRTLEHGPDHPTRHL